MNAGAVAATVTPVENDTTNKQLKAELLSVMSSAESQGEADFEKGENEFTVSITVVGASGDLAKKKIFPALFALYYEGCLPKVGCWSIVVFFICIFWKIRFHVCDWDWTNALVYGSTSPFMAMLEVRWLMQNWEIWLARRSLVELIRGNYISNMFSLASVLQNVLSDCLLR